MSADGDLTLLTHVLLSECGLPMGRWTVAELVGVNDRITHEEAPATRTYPAGSLVSAGLAERIVNAGFGEAVVELERPVVAVVLDGDDESDDGYFGSAETFSVTAYSVGAVEAVDDL